MLSRICGSKNVCDRPGHICNMAGDRLTLASLITIRGAHILPDQRMYLLSVKHDRKANKHSFVKPSAE